MPPANRIQFSGSLIEIDPCLIDGLKASLSVGAFLTEERGRCAHLLRFRRSQSVVTQSFPPEVGARGGYRWMAEGMEVASDTDPLGLSLALRGLFSQAIERQGGVLVHAAGVSWGGRAALITGVSGAGKSTLARWCVKAGATLLSDEVVGVLPDGTVLGTPFHSDPDLQGTPTESKLHLVTTLRHGAFEAFDKRPAHELIAALCEQAFHRDGQISAGQVLKCVARALDGVETMRFTCRNAASAGEALRAQVLEGATVGSS